MEKYAPPSKEQIRDWMRQRRLEHDPLPDIKTIQRDLWSRPAEPEQMDNQPERARRKGGAEN